MNPISAISSLPSAERRRSRRGWSPSLGAWPVESGTQFRLWAPQAKAVDVVLESGDAKNTSYPLAKSEDGYFSGLLGKESQSALYRYRVDGQGPYPDPASRYQPKGVHGPSQVINPNRFDWADIGWAGRPLAEVIIYELHVGTFTPKGTFAGAADRLPYLAQLGITAIELMPLADFPGARNWGYDGVSLFAPARCYGEPDDLRKFVDMAHRLGMAVFLDVVYNHLGPDGNYLGTFSPSYFSQRHKTPWGAALNLDGEGSQNVRHFFIENALYWIHEFHFDGLRLDATHAMVDESPRHFLAELSARVRAAVQGRKVLIMAEDCRNLAHLVRPEAQKGWGMSAVWSDDFHHEMRRLLAGDNEGYFQDYSGSIQDLARTLNTGWFFCGQPSAFFGGPRGTEPEGVPQKRFIFFIQNHDQIGNRAFGERLHHQTDLATYRAAAALLLCAPETPLLFMGQEWGANSPFLYFTDHEPGLGGQVTAGRREEFKSFASFSDPEKRQNIPDPQDLATFTRSRLNWPEQTRQPHASLLRFYQTLIHWRRNNLILRSAAREDFEVTPLGDTALFLHWKSSLFAHYGVIVHFQGVQHVEVPTPDTSWEVVLTTEEPAFCPDPLPIGLDLRRPTSRIQFLRSGAVILKAKG